MGLERIAAVMQGVHNNYDIDLFRRLIEAVGKLAGGRKLDTVSARVVADHIRSCAFLVMDGVLPSNEGRGYVLRRIIRRAVRHGHKLGFKEPFFHKLVGPLVGIMGGAYAELGTSAEFIERTLKNEEQRFAETLDKGLRHFDEVVGGLKGKAIPGEAVFKLYDTYGFPVDLTADIARERGLQLDHKGFDAAMAKQRERARAASRFDVQMAVGEGDAGLQSEFRGYEHLEVTSQVTALFSEGRTVKELKQGEEGGVILAATPFYAESGGQVGDAGQLSAEGVSFEVSDTQKQGQAHVHLGRVAKGTIRIGQELNARVDVARRTATMRNHSVTHIMHKALRDVLGSHVVQKGSLVDADKTRFDFTHDKPMTTAEIREVERRVNEEILQNRPTRAQVMPMDDAKKSGAVMLFGEKYGDEVRVLDIGTSRELCGGTHVERTGDIGMFKIYSESGIASGVRRVEATTGHGALRWVEEGEEMLSAIARLLKSNRENLPGRIEQLLENLRKLEKEQEQLKGKLASSAGDDMLAEAQDVGGIKVLAKMLDGADPKTLRDTVDQLKNKLGSAALVLATVQDSKVSLVAGVTKDSTDRIKAGDLVNFVAQQVGGKGGGRPDMAQAGGNDPSGLPKALAAVPDWVRKQLGS
jgi:alanyl-tRNA synthetase